MPRRIQSRRGRPAEEPGSGRRRAAAERRPPIVKHDKRVLGNGLRVLTVPTPGLHSAMLALYVRVGSRQETAATNGVSHFLEHMFFRGSEGWPDTVAMNAAVESAGGNLNGVTARDHGCYFTPIDPGELETGVAILGDMIQRPRLEGMEVEREIILSEILDEVDAGGRDIDPDNISKRVCFARHPLSFKIAGTAESVRRLAVADLRRHHERYYAASNLVLCVAGPVEPARVAELADRHFGALRRGEPSRDARPPPWPAGPVLELVDHDDAQLELQLGFPCPPETHADYPALLCIRRLLDDGLSSRLPFEVVEKRGLAYSLHAGLDTFTDCGIFDVECACAPQKAKAVLGEIFRVLGDLARGPVPEAELARVQKRHRMGLVFALDSATELAGWFGAGEVLRAPESFEERCRRVEAVTPADVQRVARATFSRERLVAVLVGKASGRRRRELEKVVAEAPGLA